MEDIQICMTFVITTYTLSRTAYLLIDFAEKYLEKMPLNPATFPRPPLCQKVSRHLQVKWANGTVIADTTNAFWVLETHHPPSMWSVVVDGQC